MSHQRLEVALKAPATARCADGCEATRALFAPAIERELRGEPPDADLYARLDRCPACAQAYIAALDLAFALDEDGVDATETPALRLPTALRFYRPDSEDVRRVAEEPAEYGEGDT